MELTIRKPFYMSYCEILELGTPVAATEVVNKQYVDYEVAALNELDNVIIINSNPGMNQRQVLTPASKQLADKISNCGISLLYLYCLPELHHWLGWSAPICLAVAVAWQHL